LYHWKLNLLNWLFTYVLLQLQLFKRIQISVVNVTFKRLLKFLKMISSFRFNDWEVNFFNLMLWFIINKFLPCYALVWLIVILIKLLKQSIQMGLILPLFLYLILSFSNQLLNNSSSIVLGTGLVRNNLIGRLHPVTLHIAIDLA
jgi:hypothetical protein